MTTETENTDTAALPGVRKIGAILTPPLERDVEYLESVGYTTSEIVRRGVGMLATYERQCRAVRA